MDRTLCARTYLSTALPLSDYAKVEVRMSFGTNRQIDFQLIPLVAGKSKREAMTLVHTPTFVDVGVSGKPLPLSRA